MSISFDQRSTFETTEVYSQELLAASNNSFLATVVDKLLERLSTDDSFRQLFETDARAALQQVGHQTPEHYCGVRGADPVMCMLLSNGLASKADIRAGHERLKMALTSSQVHNIFCLSAA